MAMYCNVIKTSLILNYKQENGYKHLLRHKNPSAAVITVLTQLYSFRNCSLGKKDTY